MISRVLCVLLLQKLHTVVKNHNKAAGNKKPAVSALC